MEGDLQISFLETLEECLGNAAASPQDLVLDISRVSGVDTAGLQLLLAFLRSRQEIASIRLEGAPSAFTKALDLTGLGHQFQSFMA